MSEGSPISMPDANFWYFIIQVAISLVAIWIGIWWSVKHHLADQQTRYDQLRADISSINANLVNLKQSLDAVIVRTMEYFTSQPDLATVQIIEERKLQEINRVKDETVFQIKALLQRELDPSWATTLLSENPNLENELVRIIDESVESISQETEEAVSLLTVSPVAKNVLVTLSQNAPATIASLEELLQNYPKEVIMASLQKLLGLNLIKVSTQPSSNVPEYEQQYVLTDRGENTFKLLDTNMRAR